MTDFDVNKFWSVIEECKPPSQDLLLCDEHYSAYEDCLNRMSDNDLLSFERMREELKLRAFNWHLWYGVCAMSGFCSDDSFSNFRAGLVMLGQSTFDACLSNPDKCLSELDCAPTLLCAERFDYLSVEVYDRRRDESDESLLSYVLDLRQAPPTGTQRDFQTSSDYSEFLRKEYPLISRRFNR